MFCLGFTINVSSDSTLLSLKANKEKKSFRSTIHPMTSSLLDYPRSPGNKESIKKLDDEKAKTSYDIPYGGLFEYVSCANYCKYDALLLLMIVR